MEALEKVRLLTQKALVRLNFSTVNYWELRYKSRGNSGDGSYGEKCAAKAERINHYVQEYSIQSVIEFGCGDGNQLKHYLIPNYLGLDVSETTIKNCAQIFRADGTKSFIHYTPSAFANTGTVLMADAAFSIEVIFHLVEDAVYEKYMSDLFSAAKRFVIIFSSDHANNAGVSTHVKHHKFTDWVATHAPTWKMIKREEVHTPSGGHLNDFFIYQKSG